jgi:hypothetical protein
MPGSNKGFVSKPSQKKKGELTPERRSRKPPHRKRPGATPEQLRYALTGVFMGFDGGKIWSTNPAANRVGVDGATRGALQLQRETEEPVCVLLRKGGFEGHAKPPPSRFFVGIWGTFSIFAGPSSSLNVLFFLPSFLLHFVSFLAFFPTFFHPFLPSATPFLPSSFLPSSFLPFFLSSFLSFFLSTSLSFRALY